MKRFICKLFLFDALLILCQYSFAQEQKYVTAEYVIPKSQCLIYAYDLENFLKSKGLYEEKKPTHEGDGKISWMKKKVNIGGIDFTKDCTFVLELLGEMLPVNDEPYEFKGSFGIIEIGFKTEAKAKEVFEKAKNSKKKTMNVPLYYAPFRCVHVGKSVLFVYAIDIDMRKYQDMAETWQPASEEEKSK